MADLDRAVSVADEAVTATPRDHPDRAMYLNNLGIWLVTRFEHTGSIVDLDRSVGFLEEAVTITPRDHPNRAKYLCGLGTMLGN